LASQIQPRAAADAHSLTANPPLVPGAVPANVRVVKSTTPGTVFFGPAPLVTAGVSQISVLGQGQILFDSAGGSIQLQGGDRFSSIGPEQIQPALLPISLTTVLTEIPPLQQQFTPLSGCRIKRSKASQLSNIDETSFALSQGSVVVATSRPITIRCVVGNVKIGSGAIVLVESTNDILSVTNLSDAKKKTVLLCCGGRETFVDLGQQVRVGKVLPKLSVPVRRVARCNINQTISHEICEVSVAYLCQNHPLVREISTKSNKEDERIFNYILKSAVCLMQISEKYGPYLKD